MVLFLPENLKAPEGKQLIKLSFAKSRMVWGYIFLLPSFSGLFIFKIFPIFFSIFASLCAYATTTGIQGFVGIENYRLLLSDSLFHQSVFNSLVFVGVLSCIEIVFGLFYAILMTRGLRGSFFFRTILFIPVTISMVVSCVIWEIMYDQSYGLINGMLKLFHLPPQPFLVSSSQALMSIIIICAWKGAGYLMIIYIAGLQGIPDIFYEVALLDGANRIQLFTKITLPLLRRTILFVVILTTTINFTIFAPVYLLTDGGPSGSTMLLPFYAYKSAFTYYDMGYANAISFILLVIVFCIVLFQLKYLRAEFEY